MIEKYIEFSKKMDPIGSGSNKKCYVFDNVVLLKGDFVNPESDLIKKEKLDILKNNGVNVCRILDNLKINDIRYELQEKAKGNELFNFNLVRNPSGHQRFLETLDSLSKQDISFFKKFLEDWYNILQMGFDVDPSKSTNFFYDGESICFIDLNITNNSEKRLPWMFKEAAVVLRGGGLLWQCKDVYEEANEKVKIIYQKLGCAALELGVDIDDYINFLDENGEYELKDYFEEYQNKSKSI